MTTAEAVAVVVVVTGGDDDDAVPLNGGVSDAEPLLSRFGCDKFVARLLARDDDLAVPDGVDGSATSNDFNVDEDIVVVAVVVAAVVVFDDDAATDIDDVVDVTTVADVGVVEDVVDRLLAAARALARELFRTVDDDDDDDEPVGAVAEITEFAVGCSGEVAALSDTSGGGGCSKETAVTLLLLLLLLLPSLLVGGDATLETLYFKSIWFMSDSARSFSLSNRSIEFLFEPSGEKSSSSLFVAAEAADGMSGDDRPPPTMRSRFNGRGAPASLFSLSDATNFRRCSCSCCNSVNIFLRSCNDVTFTSA